MSDEFKYIQIKLSEKNHMKLKIHSVKIGVTMQTLFLNAIEKILDTCE